MKFEMTSPCPKCPFRSDIKGYLTQARAREIADSIIQKQASFPCHQTTDFDEDGETIISTKEQHCAGAMILLEKLHRPNQMMRIAERLGRYNHKRLNMRAPVFKTAAQFVAAQRKR